MRGRRRGKHGIAGRAGLGGLALATLLGGSCRSTTYYPPAPLVIHVSMAEYHYRYEPPSAAGFVTFDARNDGKLAHDLTLVELANDTPPILQQLRSEKRSVVPTIARLSARDPGARGTFALDLRPGRYAIVCFVKDADGGQHAQKGMASEFRVK